MSPTEWPKISLVTPNHNYGHFLAATLTSVLDQHYPNLEYLVLDDGSTDQSVEIIRRFESRLTHWETGPNQGQYRTITRGFAQATGEIFGWLNSDDMHLPWTLRAVAEIFRTFPEVEWISSLQLGHWDWAGYCLGFLTNRGFARAAMLDGRYLPPVGGGRLDAPRRSREFIQQESTFWRRSLWERAGGHVSPEFGSAGDFELWVRFYQHAELIGVNIPLAGFRHQQQQQTSQMEKYAGLCRAPLDQFRAARDWRPSPARRWLQHTGALPAVGHLALTALGEFGYTGQRLVRREVKSPAAHWALESHRFL